jgi:hypothetical protein
MRNIIIQSFNNSIKVGYEFTFIDFRVKRESNPE